MKLTYKTPDERVVSTISIDSVDESVLCKAQLEILNKIHKSMSCLIGGLMLCPTRHKFMLDASIMYYHIEACSSLLIDAIKKAMEGEKRKERENDKESGYVAD